MVTVRNKCSSSSSQPLSKLPPHPDNNCLPFYRERCCCQKRNGRSLLDASSSCAWNLLHDGDTRGSPQRLCPKPKVHRICHLRSLVVCELNRDSWTGHGPMDVPCFAKAHKWPWQRCCSRFLSLFGDVNHRPAAKMGQQSPPPPR